MAVAIRMFVDEIRDVVSVILEPTHRRAAFAKERGDVAFFGVVARVVKGKRGCMTDARDGSQIGVAREFLKAFEGVA